MFNQTNCSAVIPLYLINPIAAKGNAPKIQTQLRVSVPNRGRSRKYKLTATPQARTEKMNRLRDSPKTYSPYNYGFPYLSLLPIIAPPLQAHHFSYNTVCHFDRTDKDEHIEHKLPDIAPYHCNRRSIGIDHRRRRSKQGKDNADKHDNRTFNTFCSFGSSLLAVTFQIQVA